jgi:NDP-sugar pyrophosphorylase family protein
MRKVMILAAGLGTRLHPLTVRCPKPLLPLMLRPMLEHVLEQLRRFEVQEVVINLHHQAEQLRQWLGDGSRWQLQLQLSHEPDILGTAGAMKRVASWLQGAPFVVINADVLTDIDLQEVWRWHDAHAAMVTMVVRPDPAARQYGAVVVDSHNRVRQISGRPTMGEPVEGEDMVFTGIQVVSPQVLNRIPPGCLVSTTAEIYPALVADGEAVYGYRHTGYWMDIGVPERYRQAHWDILDGRLGEQWLHCLPAATRVVLRGQQAVERNVVPPVVLGSGVELAPSARVGPYAVIGARCRLEANVVVQESVVGEDVRIGAGARVTRCILGAAAHVQAKCGLADTIRST